MIVTKKTYVPPTPRNNTMPSATVPGQSMSLRTLVTRFASGQGITGSTPSPTTEQDLLIRHLSRLDLADREDFLKQRSDALAKHAEAAKEKASKKAADDHEAEVLAKAKALAEQMKSNPEPEGVH